MSLLRSSLKLLTLFALLVAIAMQPVSVALSSMLGQRHAHHEPVSAKVWIGLAGNWHGTPRASAKDSAATTGHAHLHTLGLRHHHEIDDHSVVAQEPLADADGSPANGTTTSTASLAFMAGCGIECRPAVEMSKADWSNLELLPINSQPLRRIERPPRPIA